FASSYSTSTNQNSPLNSIPATMCRWYEECRVLDGELMYDAIFFVNAEIMKCLEKYKEEDLKEKDKKKNDDVKITSLIKELKSQRDEVDRAIEEREHDEDEERIEDLHAHIEELANSVINQVLEPQPTPRLSSRRVPQPNAEAFVNNDLSVANVPSNQSPTEPERVEMEVVNEEQVEVALVPMAT